MGYSGTKVHLITYQNNNLIFSQFAFFFELMTVGNNLNENQTEQINTNKTVIFLYKHEDRGCNYNFLSHKYGITINKTE